MDQQWFCRWRARGTQTTTTRRRRRRKRTCRRFHHEKRKTFPIIRRSRIRIAIGKQYWIPHRPIPTKHFLFFFFLLWALNPSVPTPMPACGFPLLDGHMRRERKRRTPKSGAVRGAGPPWRRKAHPRHGGAFRSGALVLLFLSWKTKRKRRRRRSASVFGNFHPSTKDEKRQPPRGQLQERGNILGI